jgi:tight adherence protein B
MSALLVLSTLAVAVAAASGWLWAAARPAKRWRPRPRGSLLAGSPSSLSRRFDHVVRSMAAERPGRLVVAAAMAGVALGGLVRSPAPVVLMPLAVWALLRIRRERALARMAAARRRAVAELCGVLAGELRAGRAPAQALSWAAADCGDEDFGARLAATLTVDSAQVPAALDELARLPGAGDMRQVAACWRVSEGAGTGLARALGRLAAALRAEEARRAEIVAELAGPRATARLLAALPLFGLLLGSAMGADPLQVLLRTPYGLACLAGGIGLAACGLAWTERIARQAEGAAPQAAGAARHTAGGPP